MTRPRTVFTLCILLSFGIVSVASSQGTTGCNCANASLTGDSVGSHFSQLGGPVMKTVGSSVELPGAGPILGGAGPSPRWNIDFGSDTIRIDFIQMPATYGMGAKFTFSSLDPQLAGCPPAFITGISVTTNKPVTPFNVVGAVTFTQHTVTVPIAPSAMNLDWFPGEYILIKLKFGCETTPPPSVDPCCPPWNKNVLKDVIFYKGSGSIAAPYRLELQTTSPAWITFKDQMQIYINWLHSMNTAITAITIAFRLHDEGTGVTPNTFWGPQIGPTAFITWNWSTSNVGNPVISPATGLFNPPVYPQYPLQVGTWYAVQSGMYLENGQKFFPDKCAENTIYVRVQVLAAKTQKGTILEMTDGSKQLRTVPIQ